MRPLGALCLAALGLALMHPGKDSRFAFAVGLAMAALGALGLVLVLFNVELGIDRWLAPWAAVGAAPFRVANVATLALGLVGGSLALISPSRGAECWPLLGNLVSIASSAARSNTCWHSARTQRGSAHSSVRLFIRHDHAPHRRRPRNPGDRDEEGA